MRLPLAGPFISEQLVSNCRSASLRGSHGRSSWRTESYYQQSSVFLAMTACWVSCRLMWRSLGPRIKRLVGCISIAAFGNVKTDIDYEPLFDVYQPLPPYCV
jgi:hypothetical protein